MDDNIKFIYTNNELNLNLKVMLSNAERSKT